MAYRSSRGANGGGYEANSYLEQQNDVMLDNLRDKIGNLKRVTIDIGEEARSQNRLLNDLGRDMDANQGLLGATMRKLGIVSRNKGGNVLCYLVLFSFFVFLCIYYMIR
uniref:t-SNARE coiled-coil homology domain-containing protein n=1 Tax=Panagrolaimus sp. JU765 TaxID=591449 RepID=A0AC34Q644_9BILA